MSVSEKIEHLKWSDLMGRPVIDINTAKKVGNVEDLVLDPQTYQIVELKFKPVCLVQPKQCQWGQSKESGMML